jgi:hypothetical protein
MGSIQARRAAPGALRNRGPRLAFAALTWMLTLCAAGCHVTPPLDTKPLDTAGMSYDSIQQLKGMNMTAAEVAQIATARGAGFSDASCIAVVGVYHERKQAFDAGDDIAGLMRASVGEDAIVELAKLNELGFASGEYEAMRLAGLSDAIVLEVARHRAAGKPVLAGASLANLKNAGVREITLLELARRGVPDTQASAILTYRRHGATDAQIISHFAPVQGS